MRWAADPASVPAPLGAAWYRRIEAGTAARAGGWRKEKLVPNCTHKGAPTNRTPYRAVPEEPQAQGERLVRSGPAQSSSSTPRPACHSHNAQKPKHLAPSENQAAAPSPARHRQTSGDISATPALCPLTVMILGGGWSLFRRQLPRTAHSQRKRTYQMVSFFSCGPNRGLAWARMAMSQLQRDTTCSQPR